MRILLCPCTTANHMTLSMGDSWFLVCEMWEIIVISHLKTTVLEWCCFLDCESVCDMTAFCSILDVVCVVRWWYRYTNTRDQDQVKQRARSWNQLRSLCEEESRTIPTSGWVWSGRSVQKSYCPAQVCLIMCSLIAVGVIASNWMWHTHYSMLHYTLSLI